MKVKIDENLCIGCELCVGICPEVFKMNNDKAIVYSAPDKNELMKKCKDAADQCPVSAIIIE